MSALDLVAVCIALAVSMGLVITTAVANARLTRSRDLWRADYMEASRKWATHLVPPCEGCDCSRG